jgi:hypothetical protein
MPDYNNPRSFVTGEGNCRSCHTHASELSYDNLCLACVTQERDSYRVTAEEGTNLLDEATLAFAGLANEKLKPCQPDVCIGHLGPRADTLYTRGLNRYRQLVGPHVRM